MAVFTSRSMDGKVSDSSAAEAAARPTSADEPAVFGCEERRLGGCTEPADPRRASPTLRRLSRGMISPVHAPPPLQPQATDPTPQRAHSKGRRCAGTTGHNALALLNQQQQDSARISASAPGGMDACFFVREDSRTSVSFPPSERFGCDDRAWVQGKRHRP